MKRIEGWLKELPVEYRDKAIANRRSYNSADPYVIVVDSLAEALIHAFDWIDTEEGDDYWNKCYYTLVPEEDRS
jgi:hypothetical protein